MKSAVFMVLAGALVWSLSAGELALAQSRQQAMTQAQQQAQYMRMQMARM